MTFLLSACWLYYFNRNFKIRNCLIFSISHSQKYISNLFSSKIIPKSIRLNYLFFKVGEYLNESIHPKIINKCLNNCQKFNGTCFQMLSKNKF